MGKAIKDNQILQLGFIVHDLESTKKKVAEFLDVPVPESVSSGEYSVTKTEYRGEPAPEAQCHMAFFYLGNLQIEFIEPNEAPSAWREWLDRHGEGLHHIAFKSDGVANNIKALADMGIPMIQRGEYRRGNGRYAFFDARDYMKCIIEVLESDEEKKGL